MTRVRPRRFAVLAVWALATCAVAGCARTTTPEQSSGSNWLTCVSVDDCNDGRAVRCSGDGYCLDAEGERIAAAAPDAGGASDPVMQSYDGGERATGCPAGDAACPQPPARSSAVCDAPGAREPLVPRAGEVCYDFGVHGESSQFDTSPFMIRRGESYSHFYYAVPWPAGTVGTAYGVALDGDPPSVHAWLFSTAADRAPGTVDANALGTLLFQDARLLGTWAIGGCNVVLPDDVGLELPESGPLLVQWHHYNDRESPYDDRSAFRVCTAPADTRAELAGLTILGTEDFNGRDGVPPGENRFGSACSNDSEAPITVVGLDPHMHMRGVHATTAVERTSGASAIVLDEPFEFANRHHYMLEPRIVLEPGDRLRVTCAFDNTTGQRLLYGPSAHFEMCFLFAIAHPARALENGIVSQLGALNTCW
jgi:hypothetical protein